MVSYCPAAVGTKEFSGALVIDSTRHGSDHPESMFEGYIAFGSHEGWNHAFGVLLSFAFGDVTDNDADNDLHVLFCSWISYEPLNIVVDIEVMYLCAEQTGIFSEISSQETDESIRTISCSLKMFEHNKERNLCRGPLFFFRPLPGRTLTIFSGKCAAGRQGNRAGNIIANLDMRLVF